MKFPTGVTLQFTPRWEMEPLQDKVTGMHAGTHHAPRAHRESETVIGGPFPTRFQVMAIVGPVWQRHSSAPRQESSNRQRLGALPSAGTAFRNAGREACALPECISLLQSPAKPA